jgi:flagellin
MNVSIPQSPAIAADRTPISSQETLGRSLNRLSASSRIGLPVEAGVSGVAVSERFDAQGKRVQAAMAEVQHAASAVQTADGFLGGLTDGLSRLRELADRVRDPVQSAATKSAATREFQAAQRQLGQSLGCTVAQINGGAAPAPTITFNGIELFCPDDRPTPSSATADSASLPKVRLRVSALTALVQPDRAAGFRLVPSDAAATDVLKAALQDVADARQTLGAAGARLQLEAVTLQVESENLSSALTPIRDEAGGDEFTRAATTTMLVQPGAALLAQANLKPYGALQLLER